MVVLQFIYLLSVQLIYSQTLWVYDPDSYRAISHVRPTVGFSTSPPSSKQDSLTLSECESECSRVGLLCLSFTWSGDVDISTSTSTCNLYDIRFGFPSGGFDKTSDTFGEGDNILLQRRNGTTYFEKPMDFYNSDTLGLHLIINALRLNSKKYNNYMNQKNNAFDYDQFLIYYRNGIPGYVNNAESQLNNKYSIIKEMDDIIDAEECAKYCTRNRGAIDAALGTRCISFNYHISNKKCHLLTFSLDAKGYDIKDLPKADDKDDKDKGWFYYEGLLGDGCWIIQSQCRKWEGETYISEQAKINNTFKVGKDIGIIRQYAYDEVCEKCTNTQDFNKEFEYICLSKAREYHEDFCDNDADSATVAYWAQDGAGAAEIWNSWDLTTGCVIDLTDFQCIPDQSKYDEPVPYPNTRFEGKRFRDSIGEEEFAAGVDKKRCWERAAAWYEYCELAGQGENGETVYLNVSWPSDGSYYLEPAIPCQCDEYGLKIEKGFGLMREYCTRDTKVQPWCYREKQEDFYDDPDVLCDDLTTPYTCDTALPSNEGTGCYLFYPQPVVEGKVAIDYRCNGGRYDKFKDEEFTVVNNITLYREVMCDEQNVISKSECGEFTVELCMKLAEKIHNDCGNNLTDPDEQIIVWYRPTGDIMLFPMFEAPFETTVTRGFRIAAKYTKHEGSDDIIDLMPIRNGRWQTFQPQYSGHLRQLDVFYINTIPAELTCTIWSGSGVTQSIFLNQVTMSVEAQDDGYVRFPLDNITLTAGDEYTWQVTSMSEDVTSLGDLGYVRGNGYPLGQGDLAWDYLNVAWVEGHDDESAPLIAAVVGITDERPWFEIWCVMIIVLFIIFLVFLCILHWKRKYDEDQEKKEDKKFQSELRQRAMLQAQAERDAKNVVQEEDDYDDYDDREISDYDEEEKFDKGNDDYENEPDEYDDEELNAKQKNNNLLAPDDKNYARVKSYSKNEMPGYDDESPDGDGYADGDGRKKKKRPKRKKKKKKRHEDVDYEEY